MSEKPEKPDIEFVVVVQAHSAAGRKWIEERIIPRDDTWSGVVVQPRHAAFLGDQAVADGLWISGWSEIQYGGR
jgi:hypothetical protein